MNAKTFEKYKELIIGLVVGLVAIAYLIGTTFIRRSDFVALGAEFMPQIYGYFLLFLSICQIIIGYGAAKKYVFKDEVLKKEEEEIEEKKDNKNVLLTFILIILYVASMKFLGYTISSIIFLFLLTVLLTPVSKKKNYKTYIIFSIILPIVTNYIFRDIMHLALPVGFLGI